MHTLTSTIPTVALSNEERTFFAQLGARIATLRKEQGITQVQLAQLLGVSQQTITAYEVGRRRIQVSTLPVIAKALHVPVEELVGKNDQRNGKRGPAPKIQQQLERVAALPKARQRIISEVLDSMLAQAGR